MISDKEKGSSKYFWKLLLFLKYLSKKIKRNANYKDSVSSIRMLEWELTNETNGHTNAILSIFCVIRN